MIILLLNKIGLKIKLYTVEQSSLLKIGREIKKYKRKTFRAYLRFMNGRSVEFLIGPFS